MTMDEIVADLAWVENLIAATPLLAAMRYVVAERDGVVAVEVQGAHYEARAWRHAINGRICPSHIDVHGVRRQLIIGARVQVQVVHDPRSAS
jgi:hypothetical protein